MAIGSVTTNLPNGVTNVGGTDPLASYVSPSPFRNHEWANDFDTYTAGDWTVTETQAGATQAITDADGGILALVNSAADDDLNAIQLKNETFRWTSAKQFWLQARFKISDATQSDLIIGAYITDASPLQSLPSDGIYFYKADGAATLLFSVRKNGTSSSVTMGTMVSDTYVVATAYWDGIKWNVWLDTAPVGTITDTTNVVDDEDIAVGIAVQNGEAVAKTLSVDYLLVSEER